MFRTGISIEIQKEKLKLRHSLLHAVEDRPSAQYPAESSIV